MPGPEVNPLLVKLVEELEPIVEQVGKDPSFGIFALIVNSAEGGVHTYINVRGLIENVAEGLYAELASQLESGDYRLYAALHEVMEDLAEDYMGESGESVH